VSEPPAVGVGPWTGPPPEDDRLDPHLLAHGDRRNVVDRYRYWRHDAIVADLDGHRHPLHVAVENWGHDFNIGSVIRTANAFNVAAFHIVGRRRWNRRGAMVTDRYQHELHHPTAADLSAWAETHGLPLVGVDNVTGSVPIETYAFPRRCVLVFGQEGPGLTDEMRAACEVLVHITQYGSTRSVNAGAAAAVAMYAWATQHAE
jgi:tRNA G18 (ribose-2'-O)-methylase SpoU